MTLSYTPRFHLAVPDFLSEPWHAEFAAAMESIDQALFTAIVSSETTLWEHDHTYAVGDIIIDPTTGTLYASAENHTSSSAILVPTFADEIAAYPNRWTSFAVTAASQVEAELGDDNSKYMTPLRTKQAITAQSPIPGIATQAQATEGVNNTEIMTPLRTSQGITGRIATQAQAEAGTDNSVLMTPLRVEQQLLATGVAGGDQIAFSAHKNAVAQTGIPSGVLTKITFGTELYDLGGRYDTANSRWTPPSGAVHVDAAVYFSGVTAGSDLTLNVHKNGVPFRSATIRTNESVGGSQISVDDTASGTTYYELFARITSGGTATASGTIVDTWFMGHFLGEVGTVTLGAGQVGFRAHKNSVDQNIPNAAPTKITFATEDYDQGAFYDPVLSRWTPPTGLVHIDGAMYFGSGLTANSLTQLQLFKNGALIKQGLVQTPAVQGGCQVSIDDIASGTDYYELFANIQSPSVAPCNGHPANTYFAGHFLGGSRGAQGAIGPAGPEGAITAPAINCGRLRLVSSTLLSFTPFNGDRIKINGVLHQIPAAGIGGLANTNIYKNSVGAQNLDASTTYYVYAFLNAGIVTADFSQTGHAASATVGNIGTEIKTGDDTRSLIGMVRTAGTGGVQFLDNTANRLVLSWFNRRNLSLRGTSIVYPNYLISGGWQEVNVNARANFLTWGDEGVIASLWGNITAYDTALNMHYGIGLDGATNLLFNSYSTNVAGWTVNAAGTVMFETTEGFHFVTPASLLQGYYQAYAMAITGMIQG